MIKKYYRLTKPGIIFGNLVSGVAGFFLASRGNVSLSLLLAVIAGISLIIASSCVANNIIDRDIDLRMRRTQKRALVNGEISVRNAVIFSVILGLLGYAVLLFYTNVLAVAAGMIGMFFYIVVYGWAKRNTWHSTLIGSVSGATPPFAGYIAVTNHIDTAAILLFWILVVWQMPHFYALAIRLKNDYTEAKLPVLPLVKGLHATKVHMIAWTVGFIIVASLLTITGQAGLTYLITALMLGFWWLNLTIEGLTSTDEKTWAMKTYRTSLIVLTVLCVAISLDHLLP